MSRRGKVGLTVGVLVLLVAVGVVLRRPLKRLLFTPAPWAGRFQDPEGLAIGPDGTLYIADEDRGTLFRVGRDGATIASFRDVEGLAAPLTSGDGMAVVATDRLVVIGADFNLVSLLLDGKELRMLGSAGGKGKGPGQFGDPEGISRDINGDLYVTDEDNRRVQVFDSTLRFLREWPVHDDPESICVAQDRIYITFSKNNWVGCFSKDGALKFQFGERGREAGQFRNPDFVCVSPGGSLYVTDQGNNRIQVFDLDGRPRFVIGGPGSGPGRFDDPEDLGFDSEGNLYVADGGNHRIQVLTQDGRFLRSIE